jgi:hypothetical protein
MPHAGHDEDPPPPSVPGARSAPSTIVQTLVPPPMAIGQPVVEAAPPSGKRTRQRRKRPAKSN